MNERNGDRRRLWGLRALALALAFGLWFGISLSNRDVPTSREVEASVTYQRPEGVILIDQPSSVRVTVSGPESEIRTLLPYLVQVVVDLQDRDLGFVSIGLGPEDVILPHPDLSVTSIDPNVLKLEMDRAMTRTLPLEPSFTGEPAAGARVLLDRVTLDPPKATVTGPARILEGLEKLDLSPISLDGHALDFSQTVTVLSPHSLVQVQGDSRALVRVPMDLGAGDNGGQARGGTSNSLRPEPGL